MARIDSSPLGSATVQAIASPPVTAIGVTFGSPIVGRPSPSPTSAVVPFPSAPRSSVAGLHATVPTFPAPPPIRSTSARSTADSAHWSACSDMTDCSTAFDSVVAT